MTVRELNRNQLDELKQAYATQKLDEQGESISYGELLEALDIPDEVMFEYYSGVEFSADDFSEYASNKIRLTTEEYNALNHITSATKTDCWFAIETDEDGYDYVYDLEEDCTTTLTDALSQLYEGVDFMTLADWKAVGVDEKEVGVFATLLERLNIL